MKFLSEVLNGEELAYINHYIYSCEFKFPMVRPDGSKKPCRYYDEEILRKFEKVIFTQYETSSIRNIKLFVRVINKLRESVGFKKLDLKELEFKNVGFKINGWLSGPERVYVKNFFARYNIELVEWGGNYYVNEKQMKFFIKNEDTTSYTLYSRIKKYFTNYLKCGNIYDIK